jgi:hydroxymethylpyrimidine/phosphomethylpyrimidine kinase
MIKELKSKIYRMIDSIEDENILRMVMEDITYYTSNKDEADNLTKEQLEQLDEAISEGVNNETMNWNDFKRETNEWKKDSF